jgi:hypothetical protein
LTEEEDFSAVSPSNDTFIPSNDTFVCKMDSDCPSIQCFVPPCEQHVCNATSGECIAAGEFNHTSNDTSTLEVPCPANLTCGGSNDTDVMDMGMDMDEPLMDDPVLTTKAVDDPVLISQAVDDPVLTSKASDNDSSPSASNSGAPSHFVILKSMAMIVLILSFW